MCVQCGDKGWVYNVATELFPESPQDTEMGRWTKRRSLDFGQEASAWSLGIQNVTSIKDRLVNTQTTTLACGKSAAISRILSGPSINPFNE